MFLQMAHTKTDVYQQSQNLALECYRVTKSFPSDERFAMVQQIRRATLFVVFNLRILFIVSVFHLSLFYAFLYGNCCKMFQFYFFV